MLSSCLYLSLILSVNFHSFVTQIQTQMDLVEMQNTKFECQLAPVGDPNMKVEWFFNGKPLPYSMLFELILFYDASRNKLKLFLVYGSLTTS